MSNDPEPRPSPFDGLPPDAREAMELAFVHAVVDALEREAMALNQARTDPAMSAGQKGRREVGALGAVMAP